MFDLNNPQESAAWIISTQSIDSFDDVHVRTLLEHWKHSDQQTISKNTTKKVLMALINNFAEASPSPWAWWALEQMFFVDPQQQINEAQVVVEMLRRHQQPDDCFRRLGSAMHGQERKNLGDFIQKSFDEHDEQLAQYVIGRICRQSNTQMTMEAIQNATDTDIQHMWMNMKMEDMRNVFQQNSIQWTRQQQQIAFFPLLARNDNPLLGQMIMGFMENEKTLHYFGAMIGKVFDTRSCKTTQNNFIEQLYEGFGDNPENIYSFLKNMFDHKTTNMVDFIMANVQSADREIMPPLMRAIEETCSRHDIGECALQLLNTSNLRATHSLIDILSLKEQQILAIEHIKRNTKQPALSAALEQLLIQAAIADSDGPTATHTPKKIQKKM